MLEFSKKEKTRSLVEKWKELEMRLADIRAEEEKTRKQGRPKKKMVWHDAIVLYLPIPEYLLGLFNENEIEIGIYGGQS